MPAVTREQVYDALLMKLSAAAGIVTTGRRVMARKDITATIAPVLTLTPGKESAVHKGRGIPLVRTFSAWVTLYTINSNQTISGAEVINPLLDAVAAALAPDDVANNVLTLGGLVSQVYIDGETFIATGDTDPTGFGGAVIPVKILVP